MMRRTHQIGNSTFDEIFGGCQTSFACSECGTTCRSDDSAATMNDTRYRRPVSFDDIIATINHALVTLSDEIYLRRQKIAPN